MANYANAADRRIQLPVEERTNFDKNLKRKLLETGSKGRATRYASHASKAAMMRRQRKDEKNG